jgi:hypothetical protein
MLFGTKASQLGISNYKKVLILQGYPPTIHSFSLSPGTSFSDLTGLNILKTPTFQRLLLEWELSGISLNHIQPPTLLSKLSIGDLNQESHTP